MTAHTSTVNHASLGHRWTVSADQIRLAQCVLTTAAAMVFGLAVLLLLRRWSDALHKPLGSFELVVLALALCGMAIGARLLWYAVQRWQGPTRSRLSWIFDALLTASVLGMTAAVSLPESPVLATAMLWLVAVGVESSAWFLRVRRERSAGSPQPLIQDGQTESMSVQEVAGQARQAGPAADAAAEWHDDEEESSEMLPAGVSQRITRGRDETGSEMIYGIIRCDFVPGQRQQNVHIAFCPPLQRAPQLSLDQVDGPTARLRPAVVEPFGAGVEVKLKTASSAAASVQIQFYACEDRRSG